MEHNLYFNIIPFSWPTKPITMYFHNDAELHSRDKLHKHLFPKEVNSIINSITPQTESIACTYGYEKEEFIPLEIDLQIDNQDLVKRYFNRQINYYFAKKNPQIIKQTFIKENQIWIPLEKESNTVNTVYDKFSLSVKLSEVSDFPELQISYEGKTKVLKKSVLSFSEDHPTNLITHIISNNKVVKLKNLMKDENYNLDEVFPIVNNDIRKRLNFRVATPLRDNKYKRYMEKVSEFYEQYLNNDSFRKIIPIFKDGFLKVNPAIVSKTSDSSNKLTFGNKTGSVGSSVVPNEGMKVHGPFKKSEYTNIEVFYIMHIDDRPLALEIFEGIHNGLSWFKGLQSYTGLLHHVNKDLAIKFEDKENPLPAIEKELNERRFEPNTKYFAIYLTPFSKNDEDSEKQELYYKIKETLLKRNISSQVIDPNKYKANKKNFVYNLSNISIAILAKLGGIPWRLNTEVKNELVVGVGAFKDETNGVHYVASAFSFQNTGSFNGFQYFLKEDTDLLAGSIGQALRQFTAVNKDISRLIIHFYKTMSERELEPIEKELNHLGLDIPVFIISINKTESEDIIIYDKAWSELMPLSGTYVNIGRNKYLLCNNTRYYGTTHSSNDGYAFPIKLKIDCTDESQLKETKVITGLIDQVYQFSRLYYKSIRQQNLPVTIKYPEMVAKIAPHFEGKGIPDYGKENLWFL